MLEIYVYMTNFTKGWLKYQNSYEDLTKAHFYMDFHFYRGVLEMSLLGMTDGSNKITLT